LIDWDALVEKARQVRENAYARFSGFEVGAALLTDDGRIISGCNVENSSLSLTICAERAAVFKAVSEGHTGFRAIVVYSSSDPPARPCGACRQVLYQFNPDMEVLCVNGKGDKDKFVLSQLLPEGFRH
jgi:cytidine deaminase